MSPISICSVIVASLGFSLLAGCRSSSQPPSAPASTPPSSSSVTNTGYNPAAPVPSSSFDGDEAFKFLKAQCDFGTRIPNTSPHDKCEQYIIDQMTPYVDKVATQKFNYDDPARHTNLHLTNIIGVINPDAKRKVLLFTHWDTRPTADQELDDADKKKPIIGADDGASGTADLLELAHVLHKQKPTVGVILLFVDGEDWGPGEDKMYLGARYFAKHPGIYKPDYAILLDMIGDKNLNIYREENSQHMHPELNDKVWQAAAFLGHAAQFPDQTKYQIGDDHLSFNAAGIPAIDLIDFDYAYWHTLDDTPDKCSPESLKIVGDVVAKVLYDEK